MIMGDLFIKEFCIMSQSVHQTALEKGWYGPDGDQDRNMGEVIALMHSELSEALEAHRHGGKRA